MKKQHVIIGSSAAGMGALSSIMRFEPDAQVTIITDEPYLPYNKCYLIDYIVGTKTHEQLFTRTASFFEHNKNISLLYERVVRIDQSAQQITLSDGKIITYDTLCLTMGSRARQVPWQDSHYSNVLNFHTIVDANALQDYLAHNNVRTAVVVGAGLTGLECADALYNRGIHTTVIDSKQQVLSHLLPPGAALFIHERMKQCGVSFIGGHAVQELITKNDKASGVVLADGTELYADLIIVALGVVPNSELAVSAGLKVEKGSVVVNDFLQTSDSNIWAAGDLIRVTDVVSGNKIRSCMWRDAVAQGVVAGKNMIGMAEKYPGVVVYASTHVFGSELITGGVLEDTPLRGNSDHYGAWNIVNNRLVGFVMIGAVKNITMLKRLYITGAACDDAMLHEIMFTT